MALWGLRAVLWPKIEFWPRAATRDSRCAALRGLAQKKKAARGFATHLLAAGGFGARGMAESSAASSTKGKAVRRTGIHACLTCSCDVTAVNNLDGCDITEELIDIIRQKGHAVGCVEVEGGTPAKPKRTLILNGTSYEFAAKRRICGFCRTSLSVGAAGQRPAPKVKPWQQKPAVPWDAIQIFSGSSSSSTTTTSSSAAVAVASHTAIRGGDIRAGKARVGSSAGSGSQLPPFFLSSSSSSRRITSSTSTLPPPAQVHIPKKEGAPLPQASAPLGFGALAALRKAAAEKEVELLERKAAAEKERSAAAAELALQEERRAQAAACARQEEERRAEATELALHQEEQRARAAERAAAAAAAAASAASAASSADASAASAPTSSVVPAVFCGHASYVRHAQLWVEAFEDGPTWGRGGADEMLPMAIVADLSQERNVSMRTGGANGPFANVRQHAVTDEGWAVVTKAMDPFVAAIGCGAICSDASQPTAWINNMLICRALDVLQDLVQVHTRCAAHSSIEWVSDGGRECRFLYSIKVCSFFTALTKNETN